ncbi:MAG: phosphoribosylanthranilate isomerase [Pyrinomonadaceae bacterium MAG19_C2-C3]|nr:phosphoribosylanthranilate isomerase [Pyrinomonadaceae bacterium MAG19_C2-C3]
MKSNGTRIKICGVTRLEDALLCAGAGADLLGFNFYKPSPRYVEPTHARRIIESLRAENLRVETVGVFVNEPTEEVARIARHAKLDAVQLHGDEAAGDCHRLMDEGLRVTKALRVGVDFKLETCSDFAFCDCVLLDAFDRNLYGGSGARFDWSVARQVVNLVPRLLLAGGLDASNVREAIELVAPFGVDVASGVESAAGVKDALKVRAFLEAARG